MKTEMVQLYNERYAEGYDLQCDEMYSIWVKLKALVLSDNQGEVAEPQNLTPPLPVRQQKVSSVLEEILTYPEPPKAKST